MSKTDPFSFLKEENERNLITYSRKKEGSGENRDVSPSYASSIRKKKKEETPKKDSKALKAVIGYIDVKNLDAGDEAKKKIEELGGKVHVRFTKAITHVIFDQGKPATTEKALSLSLPLLSLKWVESCYNENKKIEEAGYLISKKGKKDSIADDDDSSSNKKKTQQKSSSNGRRSTSPVSKGKKKVSNDDDDTSDDAIKKSNTKNNNKKDASK